MKVRFLLSLHALMVTQLAETWENFPCGAAPPSSGNWLGTSPSAVQALALHCSTWQ